MNRWKELLVACVFGAASIISADAICQEKPQDSPAAKQSASTVTRPAIPLKLCGVEEIRVKARDGAEAIAAAAAHPTVADNRTRLVTRQCTIDVGSEGLEIRVPPHVATFRDRRQDLHLRLQGLDLGAADARVPHPRNLR